METNITPTKNLETTEVETLKIVKNCSTCHFDNSNYKECKADVGRPMYSRRGSDNPYNDDYNEYYLYVDRKNFRCSLWKEAKK